MESFGARLKKERERQSITLEDVASSTKIGTRMLRALEEEHFDQLPGGIFNKGFVRAYARHLKIDEDEAIADYLAASGIRPPEKAVEAVREAEAQEVHADEEESSSAIRMPWGIFAAVLLVVALGFAVWGFYSRESRKPAAPGNGQAVSSPAVGPSRSSQKLGRGKESPGNAPAPQVEPASSTGDQGSLASPPAPAEGPSSAVPAPGAFLVLVKAREDSWLTITADGAEIMHDTLGASAEKSIQAQKQIVIRAGNIGALDFWFNGQKLPPQGDYDEVKILNFDGNGLQSLAKTQPPVTPSPSPQP